MPMMKSPYAHQVISLTGHSVEFEANVPAWVAENEQLISECQALGASVVEDAPAPKPAPAPVKTKYNELRDANTRFLVSLDKALVAILTRNDPADLKADGMPKLNKVVAEMSPDQPRPTATQISNAYQALQDNIDLAE